ncbi:hypothetical protein M8J77_011744 [Diaphorina citri]|nr:hypothetical protein M8J77_011744 [Diaphorina citri]
MCLKSIILFCFLISSVQFKKVRGDDVCKSKANTTNPWQELKTCLFKGYNPKAVPLQGDQKSLTVNIAFILKDIYFQDVSSEASLYMIMDMNWTDPFLKWNPKDFGDISKLVLTQGDAMKIWTPMFTSAYTYRFGGQKGTDDLFRVSMLEVNSEGKVVFSDVVNMNSICEGDLTLFPFDKYECGSVLMSDDFEKEVVFQILDKGKYVNKSSFDMSLYTKNHLEIESSKIMIDTSSRSYEAGTEDLSITLIYLTVAISRKTGTHIIAFHLPAIGLILLLLLPLWIAANSMTRFFYPLVVIFGSLFQIDAISSLMQMPSLYYNQPVNLVSFYRDLMMVSLLVLVESMVSALLWTNKPLPQYLNTVYDQISNLPAINKLIEHTLLERSDPEAIQGQKQAEYVEPGTITLKCFAKLIDRVVFCGLLFIQLILYWKLVP